MPAVTRFALVEVTESRGTGSVWGTLGITSSYPTYLLGLGGIAMRWDSGSASMQQQPRTSSPYIWRWDPKYPYPAGTPNNNITDVPSPAASASWGLYDIAAAATPGSERVLVAGGYTPAAVAATATWYFDPNLGPLGDAYSGPPLRVPRAGAFMTGYWTTSAGQQYPSYILAGGTTGTTAEILIEAPVGPQGWALVNTLQYNHNRGAVVVYPDQSQALFIGGDRTGALCETIPLQNINVWGPSVAHLDGPSARYNFAYGLDNSGRLWVMGGVLAATGQQTDECWIFDFASSTGTWTLHDARLPVTSSEGAFVKNRISGSDELIYIGGNTGNSNVPNGGFVINYMLPSPTWRPIVPKLKGDGSGRLGGHRVGMVGNHVLVYGGERTRTDTQARIPDALSGEESLFPSGTLPYLSTGTWLPMSGAYALGPVYDTLTLAFNPSPSSSLAYVTQFYVSGVSGTTGYDPPTDVYGTGLYQVTSGSKNGVELQKVAGSDQVKIYFPHGGLRNTSSFTLTALQPGGGTGTVNAYMSPPWSKVPPEFVSMSFLAQSSWANGFFVSGTASFTFSGYWLDSINQLNFYQSGSSGRAAFLRWYAGPTSTPKPSYQIVGSTPSLSQSVLYNNGDGTYTRYWLPQSTAMTLIGSTFSGSSLVEQDLVMKPTIDTTKLTGGVEVPPQYVLLTERLSSGALGSFTLRISGGLPPSTMLTATVYLAENYATASNMRFTNVAVGYQYTTWFNDVDVYATASGAHKAIALRGVGMTSAGSGYFDVLVQAGYGWPARCSAIILSSGSTVLKRINCGGSGTGSWVSDDGYLSVSPRTVVVDYSTLPIKWTTPNSGALKPHYDSDGVGDSPQNTDFIGVSFPLDEAPNSLTTREVRYGYTASRGAGSLTTVTASCLWGGLGNGHYTCIPDSKGDGTGSLRHGYLSAWPLSQFGGNDGLRRQLGSGLTNLVICFWYRVVSMYSTYAFATLGSTWNTQGNYCGYLLTIGGGGIGPTPGFSTPYNSINTWGDAVPAISYVGNQYVGNHFWGQNLLLQVGFYNDDYPFIAWQNGYRYQTKAVGGTDYYPDLHVCHGSTHMPRSSGWYECMIQFNPLLNNDSPVQMWVRNQDALLPSSLPLSHEIHHGVYSTGPGNPFPYVVDPTKFLPDYTYYNVTGVLDPAHSPPGAQGYLTIGPLPNVCISDLVIHTSDPNVDHDHFSRNYNRAMGLTF